MFLIVPDEILVVVKDRLGVGVVDKIDRAERNYRE